MRSKEINVAIGKYLRKCREEKQITQASLANCLNLSQNTICMWENGKVPLPLIRLIELADFFQINYKEFFDDLILHIEK